MLQINTGKLYADGVGRSRTIRGIFYSNIRLNYCSDLNTAAGTVIATDQLRGANTLIFEMEERLPDGAESPGVLISHGVDSYMMDFALVMSFYFNAIAHPDAELARQLLLESPSLATHKPPREYLSRCFERSIHPTPQEMDGFSTFIEQLLGLERRYYLAAMRAIKTYVVATHRLRDQLEASYALMVSSVEALVHEFDHYESTWEDIPSERRRAVDVALVGVDEERAARVRTAIVDSEHVTIGRRYREFVKRHSQLQEWGGDDSSRTVSSTRAFEIDTALASAYRLRSSYLHESKPLPTEITHGFGHSEVTYVDRVATLTFQGLARLTRCAIRGFVGDSPKVEREMYDYSLERAGVIRAKLHPSGWLHLPLQTPKEGRDRFEGLLTILAELLASKEEPKITDLTSVMKDVERIAPQATDAQRAPLLAFYHLYNYMLRKELRVPRFEEFLTKFKSSGPTDAPEWLAASSLIGSPIEVSLESHRDSLDDYFKKRAKPGGLHAPVMVEIVMCLVLAERCRQAGNVVELTNALSRAVQACPEMEYLRTLAASPDLQQPIEWRKHLWPHMPEEDLAE